jgi:NADPH:quinone reductase
MTYVACCLCVVVAAAVVVADAEQSMARVVAMATVKTEGDFSQVKYETGVPVPSPSSGQVLIRVHASSVNPVDWKLLAGFPGIRFPHTLGFDVAGVVAQIGAGCDRVKVGDKVWADLGKTWLLRGGELGAYAEYALADESQVGLMPTTMNFTEAAVMPLVTLTSSEALQMCGAPWGSPGDGLNFTGLVTSGSGGTGFTGLQLFRAWGASRVWTATSAPNEAFVRSMGATDVVNYKERDIWDVVPDDSLDVVYDNYGAPGTADKAMAKLKVGGTFIFLPGKGGALSKHPKKGVKQINFGLCDSSKHSSLDQLKELADRGLLRSHVDRAFSLAHVVEAMNTSFTGKVVGKLAITIVPESA